MWPTPLTNSGIPADPLGLFYQNFVWEVMKYARYDLALKWREFSWRHFGCRWSENLPTGEPVFEIRFVPDDPCYRNSVLIDNVSISQLSYVYFITLWYPHVILRASGLQALCIVEETNRFHAQEEARKPSTMKWVDTTVEEIQTFLGVVFAMWLVDLPEIDDYRRKGSIYGMSWFSSVFTRTRFKERQYLQKLRSQLTEGNDLSSLVYKKQRIRINVCRGLIKKWKTYHYSLHL